MFYSAIHNALVEYEKRNIGMNGREGWTFSMIEQLHLSGQMRFFIEGRATESFIILGRRINS